MYKVKREHKQSKLEFNKRVLKQAFELIQNLCVFDGRIVEADEQARRDCDWERSSRKDDIYNTSRIMN